MIKISRWHYISPLLGGVDIERSEMDGVGIANDGRPKTDDGLAADLRGFYRFVGAVNIDCHPILRAVGVGIGIGKTFNTAVFQKTVLIRG